MESALYSMFRVDLRNLVKNKLAISREYHIQPSEIDKMMYFEYEDVLEIVNETAEEEKKKQEQDQANSQANMPNMSSMMSSLKSSMPKMTVPKL